MQAHLSRIASEHDTLKKFIHTNNHFSKKLNQFFLIQRAFRKLEHHYHPNYHEFLDTFEAIVKELNLCSENSGELTNDETSTEKELVYDVHAVRSDSTLASYTSTDDDNDDVSTVEMKNIDPKNSEKILEEFNNRFFRKMKR